MPVAIDAIVYHSSLKHSFPVQTHRSRQNFCQKAFLSFSMRYKGREENTDVKINKKLVARVTLLESQALVQVFGVT